MNSAMPIRAKTNLYPGVNPHLNSWLQRATTPTLTLPLPDLTAIPNELRAVVVARDTDDQPVTRIEVLSPSNKPGGSYYGTYMTKRERTLESGLHVVELDYLHEYPPVLPSIPAYSEGQSDAYPYHVLVSVPQPNYEAGYTHVYSVGVLDVLPVFPVPLAGDEALDLDLNAVYRRLFEAVRQYRAVVDYAQPPDNFDAYTTADQSAIRAHMAHIAEENN